MKQNEYQKFMFTLIMKDYERVLEKYLHPPGTSLHTNDVKQEINEIETEEWKIAI